MGSLPSLVTLDNVSFTYPTKDSPSLENINFNILPKEIIACIGPNGAGKTTLIKLITGLFSPNSGTVNRFIDLSKIGYTPQRYYISKNFPGTVEEIISLGKALIKNIEFQSKINFLEIKYLFKKKFIDLSGGQQQKVLLALALERNPQLLILDEPTAGVDVVSRQSFYHCLSELNKKGIAILIITHETNIPLTVNRILYLDRKSQIGCIKEMMSFLTNMGIQLHTIPENSN